MFDKIKALDYILNVASNRGYSQAKLIDGIFDSSHFNRMCNGKENINIEVIFACADKLGIPYSEFFENLEENEIFELERYKDEFYKLVATFDYKGIYNLYLTICPIQSDNILFIQFKLVVKAFVEWKFNNNIYMAKKILFDALKVTIIKFDKDIFSISFTNLLKTEISIINDIAICEYSLGNYKECIKIFDSLLQGIKKSKVNNAIYIKYIYNYTLALINCREFNKATYYINSGINQSLISNNYLFLMPLYYNSFILNYLNMDKRKSEVSLEKCYSLAQSQNRVSKFIMALSPDIQKYNIRDTFVLKYI